MPDVALHTTLDASLEKTMVSAIIPTRNRPSLVTRAVHSALDQTHRNLEVIVVVDGPDGATTEALAAITDSRLRVIALPQSQGGAAARNAGAQAARGEWVALLDDDDEWLPEKIQTQLALGLSAQCADPIVSCCFVARTNSGDHVWPTRLPEPSESISEYLLVRKGLARSEGFIVTPSILTTRALLCRVPFRPGLKRHQDWDWMLHVISEPTVRVIFSPKALVVCNMKENDSVSRSADWRFSLSWIREVRPLVTRRVYASFITSHVAWQAASQHEWSAFLPLLREASRDGSLQPGDLLRYTGFWFAPRSIRRWVQSVVPS